MSLLRSASHPDTFYSVGLDTGISFEELRIQDYLKSYQITGRPPPPVPQEPTSAALRQTQGLPPLFQPFVPPSSDSTSTAGASNSATLGGKLSPPAITDPQNLPPGQSMKPVTVDRDTSTLIHGPTLLKTDTYNSISAMPEYSKFSFEELRYWAYWSGRKAPPPGVEMHPFEKAPVTSTPSTSDSSALLLHSGEKMQSFTTQDAYNRHSFEEHRVAWMKIGRPTRDITSAEQLGTVNPQNAANVAGSVPAASAFGSSFSRPLAPTQSAPSLFSNTNSLRQW